MKFIADVMLGKLAKRMRLLGYDVLYDNRADDNEIIRLALEQDRIILTRDTGLANRPLAANHVLIQSEQPREQLQQVYEVSGEPDLAEKLTRCSLCNEKLIPLSRQSAREVVPEVVYKKQKKFFQCKKCDKVYWEGTHVHRMQRDKVM